MAEGSLSPLIIKYERALEEDPRSRVFAPLAEAYRKVGLLDNAFNTLKKGLRYNPDYLLGYLTLAQCYIDKEEYSLSYSTLRPLVSQNRDNIRLQKIFARSAEKTGSKEEALDTYKYLLFLQPKDEQISQKVKVLEGELEEGVVYTPKEEIKFNVDELKPSPENDRSLDDWVQVDLSPSNSSREEEVEDESVDWIVETKDVDEDKEESIEEQATPVITHTLVDLYLQQGHSEKAIELLEKIREIQPENTETIKRLEEIKSIYLQNQSEAPKTILDENLEDQSVDEGRGNLMAAFDMANSAEEESSELSGAKVEEVLNDFKELLRQKAHEQVRS